MEAGSNSSVHAAATDGHPIAEVDATDAADGAEKATAEDGTPLLERSPSQIERDRAAALAAMRAPHYKNPSLKPPPVTGPKRAAAKEMFEKIRSMVGSPAIQVPQTVWGMSTWDVLHGGKWQQRVWTFGNSMKAEAPDLCDAAKAAVPQERPASQHASRPASRHNSTGGVARAASSQSSREPDLPCRYTSPSPLSILEGVEFIAVGAGVLLHTCLHSN